MVSTVCFSGTDLNNLNEKQLFYALFTQLIQPYSISFYHVLVA